MAKVNEVLKPVTKNNINVCKQLNGMQQQSCYATQSHYFVARVLL